MTARRICLTVAIAILFAACGASARDKAIATTFATVNAAGSGFVAFDAKHQQDIVAGATSMAAGAASLAEWRRTQLVVQSAFTIAYRAIAAASAANDDASLAAMAAAALQLAEAIKSAESTSPGASP